MPALCMCASFMVSRDGFARFVRRRNLAALVVALPLLVAGEPSAPDRAARCGRGATVDRAAASSVPPPRLLPAGRGSAADGRGPL